MHLFSCKSTFQIERIARLSLVKRAVSVADWEIVKTFCLRTIFGCKFACKLIYRIKVNPSGFLAKTTSLCQRAARLRIFWYVYLLPKFWYKRIVYVQTCGLHRRSMNAPTMLIYKYIYLWPTKINHGYTVGATIGRLISNYLNCFSSVNQQLKQTAKFALLV